MLWTEDQLTSQRVHWRISLCNTNTD